MRKFLLCTLLALAALLAGNSYAISPAESSKNDYYYTLSVLRELRIIVDNFGTEDQKKRFIELKDKFQKASERHYAQDFIKAGSLDEEEVPVENSQLTSTELFYNLKLELIAYLKEFSDVYVSRTKEMLDLISTDAMNVVIEYGKNSGLWKYFFRPIDPLVEKRPYDPKTYHYFAKRQKIESNLRDGYKNLQLARNLTLNPDYKYVIDKQKKTPREINFIIDSHMGMIRYCRQGKKCGIAVYQVINEKDLNDIIKKYQITMGMISKYPIYDDRVPEKFKPDAVDVEKMMISIEKKRVPNYDEINKERASVPAGETQPAGTAK